MKLVEEHQTGGTWRNGATLDLEFFGIVSRNKEYGRKQTQCFFDTLLQELHLA